MAVKIVRSIVFASLALVLGSAAARADELDDIRAANKIRVAIDLSTAPDGMTDANMQPTGRDVEVARLLAKELGVQMEIVNATGPTRIPLLQTNKADLVISTLSITPARAKVIDYSLPYTALQSVVAAPKEIMIKGMADLADKTVAVTRGTTQDTDLTRDAVGATIMRFDDDNTLMAAAASGQADIVATSQSLINTINKKNANRQFEPKFVQRDFLTGIAMRKGQPKLLEWVDNWVRTNVKNGTLNEIEKKYHGHGFPDAVVKASE
jgi:polar amino acid transport system substrate-binding protein